MMLQLVIRALIVALASGNVVPKINPFPSQGRIVGGVATTIEKHPWQVSLQAYGFHFCGGSIIAESVILTAGHCAGYSPDIVTIRVGTSVAEKGGSVHEITKMIRHENFTSNREGIPINDVAVIKLKTPIKLGKTAQPIRLFNPGDEAREGVLATISGWGALYDGGLSQESLQTVDVPIVNKKKCSKLYESWGGVPPDQICAAYPSGGKDTCQGDSGGPLVISGRQAGIVSWGNGCARKGYPGVYTEVAAFRGWISRNAGV